MPRFIIRLDDAGRSYYLEWSTVVDAPVTTGGTRAEFERYYRKEYGKDGMRDLPARLARVDAKLTSSFHHVSADDLIAHNRAGKGETCLTKEQIIDHYCRGNPKPVGTNPWEDDD